LLRSPYKAHQGAAPQYLQDQSLVFADVLGRRTLRTAATNQVVVLSLKQLTVGSCAFLVVAAKIWNALPYNVVSATFVDSFRHQLNTFLGSGNLVSTLVDLAEV